MAIDDNLRAGMAAGEARRQALIRLGGVGVALVATWLPARRAALVDPTVALRYD